VLRLTDASGRQLAFNDDYEDKGAGLETHHADSLIMATLPGKGTYYLHLGDAQEKGGPEYAYRLRISAPRPDFDLRVTPSSINTAGGMTVPITVYALRKDGFAGDIALTLKGAPRGFVLSGGLLPAGQNQVRLTLSVPPQFLREPVSVSVEGRASIQGHEITRPAVPAEDMMQAFAYRHLVPEQSLKVALRRGNAFRGAVRVVGAQTLRIPVGGTARIEVELPPMPPNTLIDKVQFELSEPPEGIAIQPTSSGQGSKEIVLQCDAAKAKAGLKGNLIISISAERTPPNANGRPQANRQRISLGTLPAIPFEIIPR